MHSKSRVPISKLRLKCNIQEIPHKTAKELSQLEGIIGQERAASAVKFGLSMKHHGYNIFMCGPNGTGKSTYLKTILGELAPTQAAPNDWCYVYNFEEPDYPIAIGLPAGKGKEYKKDIEDFVKELKVSLPKSFASEQYEKAKEHIMEKYYTQSNSLFDELEKAAQVEGFTVTRSKNGYGSTPIIDGKPITEEEYEALSEEVRSKWSEKGAKIQVMLNNFIKVHRAMEKDFKNELQELDQRLGLNTAQHAIEDLLDKYRSYPKILKYLYSLQQDIVQNIEVFLPKEEEQSVLPWMKKDPDETLNRYFVNLIIDNSQSQGAPVVFETIPNYQNIMGYVEYRGEFGLMVTDFTKIKRGDLHVANGGYLILKVSDLLKYPLAWEAIKTALCNKEIKIGDVGKSLGINATATLHPEPIPLELKIILLGNQEIYYLLYHYDSDFPKLFKIKAEFDLEMERTTEHIKKYAAFIFAIIKQHKLNAFTRAAVARIVEYGSEICQDQTKLSTHFNKITELIYEADEWARLEGASSVTRKHVEKALQEKIYRGNQYEEKINSLISDGSFLIDTQGAKIGEINALAVYNLGDYAFAKPSKITAKTYLGRSGVLNIEREAAMSGRIHNKGVLILSGFLGDKFAKDKPLALTASVAFEQSYEGIEGDSASAAELIAIISSLADVPIKQNYAITGSINQNGDIQPIGGVNEKITGFYNVSKTKGLTGEQGVIIPASNVKNLMLGEEVVEAIRKGKFTVYFVTHINEALELMTGVNHMEIYRKADARLNLWAKEAGPELTRKKKYKNQQLHK